MKQLLRTHSGFTLIELLVVIVLLGLLAGIMVAGVGGGSQDRELRNEVQKMFAILKLAADEAIFTNEEIGVLIEDNKYQFLVWDDQNGGWIETENRSLRTRTLPEWVSVEYRRESGQRDILGEGKKGEYFANTDTLEIEKSKKTPSFMLLSSGEIDTFTIELQVDNDSDTRIEIKTNDEGEIILPSFEREE